jgi:spermidine synthase
MAQYAAVVERVVGRCGELVLRQCEGYYEIVANGVFLMDTQGTADRMPPPGRIPVGGLGVGFSLAAALVHSGVGEVHVVEWEPAILRWNRGPLARVNGDALRDPRVQAHEANVVHWLANGLRKLAGCDLFRRGQRARMAAVTW